MSTKARKGRSPGGETSHRAALGDLALGELRRGYQPRGRGARILERKEGNRRALQPGDVNTDGSIDWHTLTRFDMETASDKYSINELDLIVPMRGTKVPVIVLENAPDDVVLVGAWTVLSPDQSRVDPYYLQWYLNHPRTRQRLQATGVIRGSTMPFWSVGDLKTFAIDVPELDRQRLLVRIAELRKREHKLQAELDEALDQLTWRALRG